MAAFRLIFETSEAGMISANVCLVFAVFCHTASFAEVLAITLNSSRLESFHPVCNSNRFFV